jgi:transcriptional regulator NrdR family protein
VVNVDKNTFEVQGETGDPKPFYDVGDLHWFQRDRQCQKCGYHFTTCEIEDTAIVQLMQLRSEIAELRSTIETVKAAAKKAK